MRKTPNKWAIGRPKMKPKVRRGRLKTDNLGSQKKPKPIFGNFMKIRKTPYKWAVRYAKMMSKIFEPRLETDDLGSQTKKNALKTRDGVTKKKNNN